jgi:hypothetical protein
MHETTRRRDGGNPQMTNLFYFNIVCGSFLEQSYSISKHYTYPKVIVQIFNESP